MFSCKKDNFFEHFGHIIDMPMSFSLKCLITVKSIHVLLGRSNMKTCRRVLISRNRGSSSSYLLEYGVLGLEEFVAYTADLILPSLVPAVRMESSGQ